MQSQGILLSLCVLPCETGQEDRAKCSKKGWDLIIQELMFFLVVKLALWLPT